MDACYLHLHVDCQFSYLVVVNTWKAYVFRNLSIGIYKMGIYNIPYYHSLLSASNTCNLYQYILKSMLMCVYVVCTPNLTLKHPHKSDARMPIHGLAYQYTFAWCTILPLSLSWLLYGSSGCTIRTLYVDHHVIYKMLMWYYSRHCSNHNKKKYIYTQCCMLQWHRCRRAHSLI